MRFLYNIGIYLYQLAIFIASFFNTKAKKLRIGQAEAFIVLKQKIDPNARYVWFHAASLGEFEQGRPVIEQLKKKSPIPKFYLHFSHLRVTRFARIMLLPILFRTYRSIRLLLQRNL